MKNLIRLKRCSETIRVRQIKKIRNLNLLNMMFLDMISSIILKNVGLDDCQDLIEKRKKYLSIGILMNIQMTM